jgi:hypothetical protein
LVIEKLKRHKSRGSDQIPAELIKTGVEKFDLRPINLLILFGIRRNFLSIGRSRILYIFIRRAIKQIVVIIEAHNSANYIQNFTQHPTVNGNSICRINYWGSSVWFSTQQGNY